MSHRFDDEEEEEDELQRILEGRDVDHIEVEEDYDSANEDNDRRDTHSNYEYSYYESNTTTVKRTTSHGSKTLVKKTKQTISKSKTKVSNFQEENHYDLENDIDSNQDNQNQEIGGDSQEKTGQNNGNVKVKVRRIVRNPQPKLNADKLMTKTGIAHLSQLFQDVKFGGKGHELNDLNKIMFKLKHWSHRLFPSLTFDDFIEKVEQLGNKRPLKTFVSKIRYDLPLNLDPEEEVADLQSDDEPQTTEEGNRIVDPVSAFDAIVGRHYENTDIQTNDSQEMLDSPHNMDDQEIETQTPNSHKEVESDINNKEIETDINNQEETNDSMSEDEIIRQLNSNDVEMS